MNTRINSETVTLLRSKLKSLFSEEDLRQFSLKAKSQLDPDIKDKELAYSLSLLKELAGNKQEVSSLLNLICTVYDDVEGDS